MWQIGNVFAPSCLSPYVVSPSERQKIADSLPDSHHVLRKWKTILRNKNTGPEFTSGQALRDFYKFSHELDLLRGESLEKSASDLYQYLQTL